jgi:signal transduction histidine kinase
MPERNEDPQWSRVLSLSVHEFRTPLTVVAGYLRMLLKDRAGPLSDQQRKLLEEAEKSCGRLTTLLAELSDLGRIEGGALVFSRQTLDLRDVLRAALDQLPALPDRKVAVVLEISNEPAPIEADAPRLTSAVTSVVAAVRRELVTADQLIVSGRRVRSDAAKYQILIGDRQTVDAVRPDASGLPAFDEWRGGCGLSLLIARRVLNVHGGDVWAPPEAQKGAAVIVIPAAQQ